MNTTALQQAMLFAAADVVADYYATASAFHAAQTEYERLENYGEDWPEPERSEQLEPVGQRMDTAYDVHQAACHRMDLLEPLASACLGLSRLSIQRTAHRDYYTIISE